MTLQPGSRLGTYEIVDLLGVGGMGEVYRARDRKLGREVAIKVLPEEFARDPSRVARFEREARMLAAVNHPTIAAIYGAEEDGATRYIVMELVEGETLAQRLASGPLAIADALRIASQIAEALEVAHEKGVIHRDLKPANIKITPEGKVKVLDFGLAKAMELPFAGDMSRLPHARHGATRGPGEIVGTPEFMSPEQARGKETDRRTDIWAFGCVLLRVAVGQARLHGRERSRRRSARSCTSSPTGRASPRGRPSACASCCGCVSRRTRAAACATPATRGSSSSPRSRECPASGAVPAARAARAERRRMAAVAAGAALAAAVLLRRAPAGIHGAGAGSGDSPARGPPLPEPDELARGRPLGLALADTVSARLANVNGPAGRHAAAPRSKRPDPNASIAARRPAARRQHAPRRLAPARERPVSGSRTGCSTPAGAQIAANAIDGSRALCAAGPRRRQRRERPAPAPGRCSARPRRRGSTRRPQQERYLEAIGLLQRYDLREGVEKALRILQKLAEEKPNSALVQAALARADLAMFDFTKERVVGGPGHRRERRGAGARPGAAGSRRDGRQDPPRDGQGEGGRRGLSTARSPRGRATSDALLGLGRASEAAGRPGGGGGRLPPARSRSSRHSPVFNQLGASYYDRGRYAEAADMFRRAAQAAPDSYWALSNLGGSRDDALQFLRRRSTRTARR